jgi:hypothetical protein
MIPCKQCLKYAVCIRKIRNGCNELYDIVFEMMNNGASHKYAWDKVHEIFPKLTSINKTSIARFGEYEP